MSRNVISTYDFVEKLFSFVDNCLSKVEYLVSNEASYNIAEIEDIAYDIKPFFEDNEEFNGSHDGVDFDTHYDDLANEYIIPYLLSKTFNPIIKTMIAKEVDKEDFKCVLECIEFDYEKLDDNQFNELFETYLDILYDATSEDEASYAHEAIKKLNLDKFLRD